MNLIQAPYFTKWEYFSPYYGKPNTSFQDRAKAMIHRDLSSINGKRRLIGLATV